jgi:hypothetical protein
MTARCHWCRHVFGVNEQVANGAVPDAVLPFHIKKDDAVARIRQFVDKRRLFALKEFKEQFTPENVVGVYLPYMIVDGKASADVAGHGEIETRELHPRQRQRREDLLRRRRLPGGTARGLHRRRPAAGVLHRARQPGHRRNTNNIINTILPFDTKNAVKWNASYLSGYTSEKRDLDVAHLRPRLEDQLLSIARARSRIR